MKKRGREDAVVERKGKIEGRPADGKSKRASTQLVRGPQFSRVRGNEDLLLPRAKRVRAVEAVFGS